MKARTKNIKWYDQKMVIVQRKVWLLWFTITEPVPNSLFGTIDRPELYPDIESAKRSINNRFKDATWA